jgi:protein-disulfide isomerase-like protein with CxxC motif
MDIEFWIDPICPWCWVTARWVVDVVQPERDLNITWQPISLFFKNKPTEDSEYYKPVWFTHRLLRVIESVRAGEGAQAIQPLYWEMGRRIHYDKNLAFSATEVLEAVGLPTTHAAAFDDEAWDDVIRAGMDRGLALTGNDVGTPIIALDDAEGNRTALFGPVITKAPQGALGLQLWDGFVACATVPGFWELKRTRTERPEFGERP